MTKKSSESAQPRLLDLRASARFLGVCVKTLRGYIRDGKIPVVQSGPRAKQFVDAIDLESFIATHTRREEVK